MKSTVLNILKKHLGDPDRKKGDNYRFYCPFCKHRKKKLEFDLGSGLWRCWTCPKRGFTGANLLYLIGAPSSDISLIKSNEKYKGKKIKKPTSSHIFLPKEYTPLYKNNSIDSKIILKYLFSRGLTPEDVVKYKLGYIKGSSDLVIPSYNRDGFLNYFVKKNIRTGAYINPEYSKDQIIFDIFINWDEPVILVEGMFDAMTIKRNATPSLGLILQDSLKKQILLSENKKYYICMDGGVDTFDISNFLLGAGKEVYKICLPEKEDPNSVGYNKFWFDYFPKSVRVTEESLLQDKLKLSLL